MVVVMMVVVVLMVVVAVIVVVIGAAVVVAHSRARLFRVPCQMVLPTETRVTRLTNMVSKTKVSVFMSSEIFRCKKLFLALRTSKFAILRRPS